MQLTIGTLALITSLLATRNNGGTAWYDLSALDGDPFLNQRRVGYWPNTNCQIVCNPGETSRCEWPVMPTCPNPTDMVLALC
ncbi:hypothetical protein PG996_003898 [Apiospora saccharicola]|uniref:Uncharacterized protein n=1 Tax=Apiospora saccharicola TaxID=335842 RepID=A0ABR1W2M8_9PEZI